MAELTKSSNELTSLLSGSKGAPKIAIFANVIQKAYNPGDQPSRADKETFCRALGIGANGGEVRAFNKLWRGFIASNPRYNPASPEYSPGGRRGTKTLQASMVDAMSGKTVQVPPSLARKVNNLVLATEDLAGEFLMRGQPGYTAKESRKFTNGARLSMYTPSKGGRTKARKRVFNGAKAVLEKRDAV